MCALPSIKDVDQSKKGWYLDLMAPNTRGPEYSWLDPTSMYMYPEALDAAVDDMVATFSPDEIDLVAGIDSVGYVLGTRIAQRLGKGFMAIKKWGGYSVDVDSRPYRDYAKTPKTLEIRKKPFPEGTRVLIVDQWIETGGTMECAGILIEQHGGKVAGISAICIEESEGGIKLCSKYKYSHCTPSHLQQQVNNHYLESFKLFKK